MWVEGLTAHQFRNLENVSLRFSAGRNVFVGANGQGKTNLLEAVGFLSRTRTDRTSSDRELIQFTQPYATVSVKLLPHRYQGETKVDVQLMLDPAVNRLKTVFKLNGSAVKSRSQILGSLPAVTFFLSDLLMVRGTPSDRRQWVDTAGIQYDKRHFDALAEFQKIRIQKAKLLKQMPPHAGSTELANLNTWNEQFGRTAARLTAFRVQYLALVGDRLQTEYDKISGGGEPVSLTYECTVFDGNTWQQMIGMPPDQLEEALYQGYWTRIQERQADEIRMQTCLVGPHREDIRFDLAEANAATYASQGQQRSIVLALKLAELALLTHRLGEPPVLLLDDVMAELDPARQAYLIQGLDSNVQVFMTTTHLDPALLAQFQNSGSDSPLKVFEVNQGQVVESAVPVEAPV